jgi:outer membrane lipoprotein-sorting protein
MRTTIVCFIASLCACGAWAQQIDADFAAKLKTQSATTETIESDFTLTRTMSFMTSDVVSKGRFYYLRDVGISLEFTDPAGDRITMGRERFKIVSAGKTSIVKLDANPALRQLKRMLSACMTGDIVALKEGAKLTFADEGGNYVVTIALDNRNAKGMIRLITLTFEKEHMSLATLRMEEASGDASEYRFTGKKFNNGVDAAHFEIK